MHGTVIRILDRVLTKVRDHSPFDRIENMAFYEFLDKACHDESNLKIKLNLLWIRRVIYIDKQRLGEDDHQFLLAYLEGAMLDVSV